MTATTPAVSASAAPPAAAPARRFCATCRTGDCAQHPVDSHARTTAAFNCRTAECPDHHAEPEIPALQFFTAREIAAITPEHPDWILEGFLAVEALTELDGKVKSAGKTTLILDQVSCILDGRPWAGYTTRKMPVVYVTEQQHAPFFAALQRAGLAHRDDLHVLFARDMRGAPWADVVAAATAKCQAVESRLLIIDTIAKLSGIRDENGSWDEAMTPLQDAASAGLAIYTARHSRKGYAEVGEAGRGHSSASGDVDIILDLRRPEGNQPPTRRVLESLGRYDQTPLKIVIDLTPEGYTNLGGDEAVSLADAQRFVTDTLRSLDQEQDGLTRDQLAALGNDHAPAISAAAIRRALDHLTALRAIQRSGRGVRGDPFQYAWNHGDTSSE